MQTNEQIVRSVLTNRQVSSLLSLKQKVDRTGATYTRISPAQLNAMQIAWDALKAAGGDIPEIAYKQAKDIGLK